MTDVATANTQVTIMMLQLYYVLHITALNTIVDRLRRGTVLRRACIAPWTVLRAATNNRGEREKRKYQNGWKYDANGGAETTEQILLGLNQNVCGFVCMRVN